MKLPRSQMKRARIEIIPMIDTIFFLLVFFMITSLSMVRMKAMSLTLPRPASSSAAAASSPTDSQHLVILTVSDAGGYYIGTRPIAPETLSAELAARSAADPHAIVVLNIAKISDRTDIDQNYGCCQPRSHPGWSGRDHADGDGAGG